MFPKLTKKTSFLTSRKRNNTTPRMESYVARNIACPTRHPLPQFLVRITHFRNKFSCFSLLLLLLCAVSGNLQTFKQNINESNVVQCVGYRAAAFCQSTLCISICIMDMNMYPECTKPWKMPRCTLLSQMRPFVPRPKGFTNYFFQKGKKTVMPKLCCIQGSLWRGSK